MVWWARGPALKEGHLAARVGSLSPWMLCFPCCGLCHLLACSFSLRHTASVLTWGEPLPPQGGEAAVAGAGGRCPSHECANRKRGREGESWPPGVDVFRKAASSFLIAGWFPGPIFFSISRCPGIFCACVRACCTWCECAVQFAEGRGLWIA